MCFNCHGVIGQLDPMPQTIAQLKDEVSRERRKRDRRWGKPDSRVFVYERRVGERRSPRETDLPLVDDRFGAHRLAPFDRALRDPVQAEPERAHVTDRGRGEHRITCELIAELRPAGLAG